MLDSDFTGSLKLKGTLGKVSINQNNYKITVNSGGIEVNYATSARLFGGIVTSTEPFLKISLMSRSGEYSYLAIDSVIAESNHRVGLRITGNDHGEGGVFLGGEKSNTFTGNVEVSGSRNHLVLDKRSGAIAVRSDILVKDRALVRFSQSNQTLASSNVTLKNEGVLQSLANSDITNRFHNLVIEDRGVVHFNHGEGNSTHVRYYIKVDDLKISSAGHLTIQDWKEGRDFLLVRKNSASLQDALTKMSFAGYDRNNIHLEDFDTEYWSISATPEPATCGAILGAVGLGLRVWRRHKLSQRAAPK